MGLNSTYLTFFDTNIKKCGLDKTKMLELGDQVGPEIGTGKKYYTTLGFDHTSVDLTGNHGSVIKDLRYPKEFEEWFNQYNIITNAGTTEHVEPSEYQYDCFSILHNCLKTGGIQLHVVPSIEGLSYWSTHCTVYYSMNFFNMLAKENSYEIVDMKMSSNHLLLVCLMKLKNISFMSDKSLFLNNLYIVPENIHTDSNPSSKMKRNNK